MPSSTPWYRTVSRALFASNPGSSSCCLYDDSISASLSGRRLLVHRTLLWTKWPHTQKEGSSHSMLGARGACPYPSWCKASPFLGHIVAHLWALFLYTGLMSTAIIFVWGGAKTGILPIFSYSNLQSHCVSQLFIPVTKVPDKNNLEVVWLVVSEVSVQIRQLHCSGSHSGNDMAEESCSAHSGLDAERGRGQGQDGPQ